MNYNSQLGGTCKAESLRDSALPCLNSNISIETPENTPGPHGGGQAEAPPAPMSTQHRKTAFILKESVQKLADDYGIQNLGFLTLTFSEHITRPKEAQRRLNSLISNVIKPRYSEYIGVMERQKSGRIHYHMLIVLGVDIRSGFDFSAIENHDYSSASPDLRSEWSFWRSTAPKYGFGRTELLPVKSNIEAMAKYVGKYIAKHCENRSYKDKGVRLVRYSSGARAGTTKFQFHSRGSQDWRRKVAIFAQIVQEKHPHKRIKTLADLSDVLGKRWAYEHREDIFKLP